jgi:hypothetical protein
MTTLVVLTVVDVVLLVAGLAFYLFWVGTLLTRIAGNLEESSEIPASSTSTGPAGWWPARCRCCTGWRRAS